MQNTLFTSKGYRHYFNLADFFEETADKYIDCNALIFSHATYSYEQLNTDSSAIVQLLKDEGFKRGDVIAIASSKEYASYVLMLACIKAGIIYTNIDPDVSFKWLSNIMEICHPKKIFYDGAISNNLKQIVDICSTDELLSRAAKLEYKHVNNHNAIDGSAIAYIMFTSGSTGKPKGAAITHQNLINFIYWGQKKFNVESSDIFTNVNPMYFDNSVFDFYLSLFSGAALVPIKKEIVTDPKLLIEYVDKMKCTVWFSVPSLLMYLITTKVLHKNSFSSLKYIIFGGEGYPKIELKKLFDLYSNYTKFINVYGPTESTCICSSYEITDQDFVSLEGLPPLGKINENFSFLILDDLGGIAKSGELCLISPNVGAGYYGDLQRSKESFILYTGHGHFNAKMYKTGDLVYCKDENLYFLGRKDHQIKHMGHRIELEAIENIINQIEQVKQVVVIHREENAIFGKLIAFISCEPNSLTSKQVDNFLSENLPSYMMPNGYYFFEELPKNANGKIDRSYLKTYTR